MILRLKIIGRWMLNHRAWFGLAGLLLILVLVLQIPTSRQVSKPTSLPEKQQQLRSSDQPKQSDEIGSTSDRKPSVAPQPESTGKAAESKVATQRPDAQQRKDSDKGDAIKWTDVVVAVFTIVLAGVAVAQAHWTRKAVGAAKEAADAAKASAEVANTSLLKTQRAVVGLQGLGGAHMFSGAPPIVLSYVFRARWVNTGPTAAVHCKAGLSAKLVEGANAASVSFDQTMLELQDAVGDGAKRPRLEIIVGSKPPPF